jgi:hypothetical protein
MGSVPVPGGRPLLRSAVPAQLSQQHLNLTLPAAIPLLTGGDTLLFLRVGNFG